VRLDPVAAELLTTFTVRVPPGAGAETQAALAAQEARRTAELAREGHLIRLWRLPGEGRNLGHWQARDADQLAELLASLPMSGWLQIDTLPLSRHPSDPGAS
jgi:muconolactone delta-isomerase